MTFRVGQKVVFIGPDCNAVYQRYGLVCPVPKEIYTIRSPRMFFLEKPGYLLEEIVNSPLPPLTTEMLIDEMFLRPLVEHKTSIEIFTRMLNPSRENMDA